MKLFSILVIVVIVCLTLSHCESYVLNATNSGFDRILNQNAKVLVAFVAPWCRYCKQLYPVYEKVAKDLIDVAKVVRVDCEADSSLCNRFKVEGFPTIKLFVRETKVYDFGGEDRSRSSLVQFVRGGYEGKPEWTVPIMPATDEISEFIQTSTSEMRQWLIADVEVLLRHHSISSAVSVVVGVLFGCLLSVMCGFLFRSKSSGAIPQKDKNE